MLPTLRRNIKTDVSKNRSLKDILPSTAKALEVLSVETVEYEVYNTKVIVKVLENDVEEDRVLFYDRLNIKTLLQGVAINGETIEDVIEDLNSKGYDFTTDDIELVGGEVVAKATSLGYYNGTVAAGASDRALFLIGNLHYAGQEGEDASYEGFRIKGNGDWLDYTIHGEYSFPEQNYPLAMQGLYLEDDDTFVANFWEWVNSGGSDSHTAYRDGLFVYNIAEEAIAVGFEIANPDDGSPINQRLEPISNIPPMMFEPGYGVFKVDGVRRVVEDTHVSDVTYNTLNSDKKDQVTLAAPMYRRGTGLVNTEALFGANDQWYITFNAVTKTITGLVPGNEGYWDQDKWMSAGVRFKINNGPVLTAKADILPAIADYLTDEMLWIDENTGTVITNAMRRVEISEVMRNLMLNLVDEMNALHPQLDGRAPFGTLLVDPSNVTLNNSSGANPENPFCIWSDMNTFQSMDAGRNVAIAGLGSRYFPNWNTMLADTDPESFELQGNQFFYRTANHKLTILPGNLGIPQCINLFDHRDFPNNTHPLNVYSAFTLDRRFVNNCMHIWT